MGQRRVAFTAEESLLLTIDGGSVIAYEPVTGALKWSFSAPKVNLVSVVYISTAALPADVAAGPWRSPSSASTAVALDGEGVLHVLDAVLGRELGTLDRAPDAGDPITLASGGDALAVGFSDRIVLYRGGQRHEVRRKVSALGFSRDGLTLAIGTARGEVLFLDVASLAVTSFEPPPGGTISDVVARPGGGWLVSSERGLTALQLGASSEAKNEKQLNGSVTSAVVDPAGKRLAVLRSEANVVLYDWPPTVPVGRVSASGGTIRDLAFGAEEKLGVAMAGGGAAVVDVTTFGVQRTDQRPGEPRAAWLVSAESEEDRRTRTEKRSRLAEAHDSKSSMGARLGIGGILSLAVLVIRIFLIGARATTPTWTPPLDLGKLPGIHGCDRACEMQRLTALETQCRQSPEIACLSEATRAREAFMGGDCKTARASLETIGKASRAVDGGTRGSLVSTSQLLASLGLDSSCIAIPEGPRRKTYELVHLSGPQHEVEKDDLTLDPWAEHALWAAPDGVLFLGSRVMGGTCELRRRAKAGEPWVVDLRETGCVSVSLFGRSSREVYVNFGDSARRFDGTRWQATVSFPASVGPLVGTATAGADVYALEASGEQRRLFQVTGKIPSEAKVVSREDSIEGLFGGTSLWATSDRESEENVLFRWSGRSFVRRGQLAEAGSPRVFHTLWQSPGGHLFVPRGSAVARSKNEGATWEDIELGARVDLVWGRSNTDVYAAGVSGLYHFDGKAWSEVDFAMPVTALAGDAKSVHLLAQRP